MKGVFLTSTMGISYKIELNKVMMSKEAKRNYVEEMKKNFTDK